MVIFCYMTNWNLLWCQRLSNISSTSHFASLSMTMGGGRACGFFPSIGSSGMADNFTTLNTRCNCLILWGNLRQQANGPTWHSISNGSSLRCDNFRDRCVVLISDVSRYIWSPGLNMGARDLLRLQYHIMSSCTLQIADLASLVADFILFMNLLIVSKPEGFCLGLKPIWGIYPVSSRNGDCCIAE